MNMHFAKRQSNHYRDGIYSHFKVSKVSSTPHPCRLLFFTPAVMFFHTTDFKVCAKLKCNASCSVPRDYLCRALQIYAADFFKQVEAWCSNNNSDQNMCVWSLFCTLTTPLKCICTCSLDGWLSWQLCIKLGLAHYFSLCHSFIFLRTKFWSIEKCILDLTLCAFSAQCLLPAGVLYL